MVWSSPREPVAHRRDIAAIASFAREVGLSASRQHVATPYSKTARALGATLVVHSTTKVPRGSDVVGGFVALACGSGGALASWTVCGRRRVTSPELLPSAQGNPHGMGRMASMSRVTRASGICDLRDACHPDRQGADAVGARCQDVRTATARHRPRSGRNARRAARSSSSSATNRRRRLSATLSISSSSGRRCRPE